MRAGLESRGATAQILSFRSVLLLVNNRITLGVAIKQRTPSPGGTLQWRVITHAQTVMDFVLVQLFDESLQSVVAQYLFEAGQKRFRVHISEPFMNRYASCRIESLDALFSRFSSERIA